MKREGNQISITQDYFKMKKLDYKTKLNYKQR